uniref:Uncharacterized protein n=1 Tax=Tetradesmus obliquus TaxID=3088 RepID=A0A383VC11_TETOB|eukprot:jgi/Sobl393_1/17716/SZX63098.1
MSSTAVLGFIKDINNKNIKAVNDRLKKDKPNQRYSDPKAEGLVYTLLHAAAATGSQEITAALLKAGADVNAKDSKGKTPLAWLASHTNSEPHLKVAELLLKQKDIDIQAASSSKATPLHEAAAAGNTALVQLLLQKGACPTDSSPGYPPLHAACQGASSSGQARMPVVELLLQAASEQLQQQDAAGFTALMRLLQRGMWSDARQLLAAGDCSLNAQAPTGETALLLACSCAAPDLQLVSDLLAAGASAAAQDSPARNTPLLLAVKAGGPASVALAQLLLQAGSCQEPATVAGRARPGDAPLQDRCNINASNAAGETALSLAAAAALAGKAAAPAAGAGKGAAAAAAAAAQSSVDAAQQLLAVVLSGRPAVPEQLGATLLEAGLSGKLPDAVTAQLVALLPAEAVARAAAAACLPQPLTFQGLLGLKLHRTAVAHLVKSSGKEPGAPQDAAGNSHLHNAVSGPEDLPDLVAALLAVGLPADAVNGDGDTALHVAARAGHVEACRALVAGGADVMRRNNKNRVPGNQLQAEEAWRLAKEQKNHQLWDAKMKATQTASAFGIRVT